MILKPQDILIALKLLVLEASGVRPSYAGLAQSLGMSASEVHAGVKRGLHNGLLRAPIMPKENGLASVVRTALREFLTTGLRYVWAADIGAETRGLPTATSYAPATEALSLATPPGGYVWPHPEGTLRAQQVTPLFPKATHAAAHDKELYLWLAIIDIVRCGSARERTLACQFISAKLR